MDSDIHNWLNQDIDHKTDYQTFKKKWGKDPRFEALDRKEREVLLNEKYVKAEHFMVKFMIYDRNMLKNLLLALLLYW